MDRYILPSRLSSFATAVRGYWRQVPMPLRWSLLRGTSETALQRPCHPSLGCLLERTRATGWTIEGERSSCVATHLCQKLSSPVLLMLPCYLQCRSPLLCRPSANSITYHERGFALFLLSMHICKHHSDILKVWHAQYFRGPSPLGVLSEAGHPQSRITQRCDRAAHTKLFNAAAAASCQNSSSCSTLPWHFMLCRKKLHTWHNTTTARVVVAKTRFSQSHEWY